MQPHSQHPNAMAVPNALQKFYGLAHALAVDAAATPNGAHKMAFAILHIWQKKQFSRLAQRIPYGSGNFVHLRSAQLFAEWLTIQPFPISAYWLASAYAIWVGKDIRSQQAMYFTPPKLAERVIDDLVDRGASLSDHHWHDPACGGAAFLVPITIRMVATLTGRGRSPKEILKRIENKISGTDLDETLLGISRQFLHMALYSQIISSGYTPRFILGNADGLGSSEDPYAPIDVVACNPPYRKLNSVEVKKYSKSFHDVIRSQPNIYTLFMSKALDIARPGGLIGLITPTSFLSGSSFSKLRTKLIEGTEVLQMDLLDHRMSKFIAVEQETVITILQRKRSTVATRIKISGPPKANPDVCILEPDGQFTFLGKTSLSASGLPWGIPRSASDVPLISAAHNWLSRINDYGYTPKIGHLVPFRDKRQRYSERPNQPNQSCIVPILWAGDITPSGFDHMRKHKLDRKDYFVKVESTSHASVIRAPSVVLQRLTSNDQAHRLIASAVPQKWQATEGGFVAENHVIILIADNDMAWDPKVMATLFNSDLINQLYRAISGATNVAINELNQLPLPCPSKLKKAMAHHADMNVAVRQAFGISARHVGGSIGTKKINQVKK
jgi:adenine-specific DNA-methyltransferase